jgi:hypothetical protein
VIYKAFFYVIIMENIEHYKNLSLEDIVYVDDDGIKRVEQWKDIPEYEGAYMVSDLGRIKSLPRIKRNLHGNWMSKDLILKNKPSKRGYICFTVKAGIKYKTFSVHQLMCVCFLDHRPDKTNKIVVDHINGNRIDNRLVNLQLITNRENISKAIRLNKKTDYVGVYSVYNGTYRSTIQYKGKAICLGTFKSQEKASECYQDALKAIDNGNEIISNKKKVSSTYKGISFFKKREKWISEFFFNGKNKRIGVFSSEKEAFEARLKYIKSLEE